MQGWLERENRRTKLSKAALLEALAEESIHAEELPRHRLQGPEHSRRTWVIGTGLDVWELVGLHEGKGREMLLEEHKISERQIELALSYRRAHLREIDEALEENARPHEDWHEIYP